MESDSQAKPAVTVSELDNLCKEIFEQKAKIKEVEDKLSDENKKLAELQMKATSYLTELDRENYKSEFGTLYVQNVWSWTLPKTDEDKAKFFGYLKEKGLFDKYATVNHASYNSYLKAEFEAAKEDGRGMDFSIPGVPEPTLFKKLGSRRS